MDAGRKGMGNVKRLVKHWFAWIRGSDEGSGTISGVALIAVAAIMLGAAASAGNLLLYFGLRSDPKRANMSAALKHISLWVIPVMSILTSGLTLGTAMGWPMHIETAIPMLVGVLFLIAGNYLPKTKQSYTMGIRLPWTLASEENWNRTHRLSGFLWVAAGALFILFSLLRLWNGWLLGILLFALIFVPVGYSYFLYRKGI